MLTDEELRAIQERLSASTPGPWTIAFNKAMRGAWAVMKAGTSQTILHLEPTKNTDLDEATHQVDADLDLVQYAREDLAALLEMIRELKGSTAGTTTETAAEEDSELAALRIDQILLAAIQFYADPQNYRRPDPATPGAVWIGTDLGQRARAALAQVTGVPEGGGE